MYDDQFDSGWGERPRPLLRRPSVQGLLALFVIVAFLTLTLMSTCAPRTEPIGTTTTTLDGVTA